MRSAMIGVAALLAGGVLLFCVGCASEETPQPKEKAGPAAPSSDEGAGGLAPEAQRLIGLWKGKMTAEFTVEGPNVEVIEEPDGPEELEVSAEFKDDGTLKMNMFFELSGTWELVKAEGDKLTVNSVLEMEMPSPEGEATETTEEIEGESEKEEMEFTIVFETDDRITMAPTDEPDEAATLERQQIAVIEIQPTAAGPTAKLVLQTLEPREEPPRVEPPVPQSEAARKAYSANNLKQLVLALHNYHDSNKSFPPAYSTDKDGKPLLSWRVLTLPFIEQRELYKQFHLHEPWDSEHNKKLIPMIPMMPSTLRIPGSKAGPGKTNYLGVGGRQGIFPGKDPIRFAEIIDGMPNTIVTVEVSDESAVIWTKPDDFVPDPANPKKGLLGLWKDGFHAGLADGHVRFLSEEIDDETLAALFTRNGMEPFQARRLGAPVPSERPHRVGPLPVPALPTPPPVRVSPLPPPAGDVEEETPRPDTGAAASPSWARKWTDNTGKYSVEAELVSSQGGQVTLRKPDGSVVVLPIARLSDADRRYLESLQKPAPKQSTADVGAEDGSASIVPPGETSEPGTSQISGKITVPAGSRLDLAYLPPDAELIFWCRVADIWNAPFLEPLVNHPKVQEQISEMRDQIGLAPADVQSVMIGADLSALQGQGRQHAGASPMSGGFMPTGSLANASGVTVIRTSKPFEKQRLIDYAQESENAPVGQIEELTHAGESYYRVPTAQGDGSQYAAVFFPDDKTIVMGPEEDVKNVIGQGADSRPRPELDFLDLDQHLVLAAVPKDPEALGRSTRNPPATAPESVKKLKQALAGAVKAGGFGLTFTDGIDFQMQYDCVDAKASEQIATLMNEVIADLHKQFDEKLDEAKVTAPTPLLAELVDVAKQVFDSIQMERRGTTVAIMAALPSSARDTFAKIPDAVASVFQPPRVGVASGVSGKKETGDVASESLLRQKERERPKPLEGVTLDAFNAAWRIRLDVQGQPASELLNQLAEELGLKLKALPGQEAALSKPIRLKLEGNSRLEAIDRICRQIGLYPNFPEFAPDTMTLKKGPRPWPATFAGPFLIEVTDLKENVPYATGDLRVRVLAAGLPPSLASLWSKHNRDSVEVTQISDAQGHNLLDGISSHPERFRRPPSIYRQRLDIALKNLLKNVDAIKVLKGNIRLSIPTKVDVLKFDQLTEGRTQTAGDVRVTLRSVRLGGWTQLQFQFEGTTKQNVETTAYDADGCPLDTMGSMWGGFSTNRSANLRVRGQPESVAVRIVASAEDVEYAFALPEIGLRSHDQMPQKLEPVQFAGSEPVTCKFVKFAGEKNSPKIVFQVTNHANKDISSFTLQLSYRDANGKTLKGLPLTQRFGRSYLAKQSVKELEFPASFTHLGMQGMRGMQGPKTVSARTDRVTFADASVWDRADVLTDDD